MTTAAPFRLSTSTGTFLQFCSHSTYTGFMFSSLRSAYPGVRAARRLWQSVIASGRPWAALAMIVLWTAAPAVAAACSVHCQTVNLHACCQQHSASMPNMPMPNTPAPHRHMTNPPMSGSCSAFGFEAAFVSATVAPENPFASAFARTVAMSSFGAGSDSHSASKVIKLASSANRDALAPAISAVPLRI